MRAMVITHTHAKGQGERSFGSKIRVETDGQTDRRIEAIALPSVLMRSVNMFTFAVLSLVLLPIMTVT